MSNPPYSDQSIEALWQQNLQQREQRTFDPNEGALYAPHQTIPSGSSPVQSFPVGTEGIEGQGAWAMHGYWSAPQQGSPIVALSQPQYQERARRTNDLTSEGEITPLYYHPSTDERVDRGPRQDNRHRQGVGEDITYSQQHTSGHNRHRGTQS